MFSPENLGARRWLLLFLAVGAVISVAILFRSWNNARVPRPGASLGPVLSRPIDPAAKETLRRAKVRPNPAMQKAGPPDPVAQKSAETSAEKAARAAAELAGASNK